MVFFILLIIIVTIPLMLVGKKQREIDAKAEMEKMIDLQQVVIENWYEENLADIRSITHLPVIQNKDLDAIEKVFKNFQESHTKFDSIVYANADGIVEVADSGQVKVDITTRQYYRQARQGKPYISEVLTGKKTKNQIIIFSVPVYDDAGQFQGLVFGSVLLETVQKVMAQFQDDSSETYLVNQEGKLMIESRQGETGDRIYTDIIHAARSGVQPTGFYETANGESVLGTYRWVNNGQWLIIGEVTRDAIYHPLFRLIKLFSIELFLLLTLGAFSMIWFSNRIEKVVYSMLEATRRIGQGEWDYRLANTNWKIDEFQELGHNFNEMAHLIENYMVTIEKSEERFRLITQSSSDMISIHDAKGHFIYVSPAGKEILHYEDEEIIGHLVFDFMHEQDIDKGQENYQTLGEKGHFVFTYRLRRKDGEYIWMESSIRKLQGDHSSEPKIYAVSRNVTERKSVEEQLREANRILHNLSIKDGLTNVWNRRSFDEQIKLKWEEAKIQNTALSLILFDVDYFKNYNDTYGHQAGDDCLISIAQVLNHIEEKFGYTAYRYGGEEFCILLPSTTADEVKQIAADLRIAVENLQIPHRKSEVNDFVTISCGAHTHVPTEKSSMKEFIENTDRALYKAKKSGRNRVKSYEAQKRHFSETLGFWG